VSLPDHLGGWAQVADAELRAEGKQPGRATAVESQGPAAAAKPGEQRPHRGRAG